MSPPSSWTVGLRRKGHALHVQVARSATSPLFAYVSNSAPDSSLCEATAPRLHPFQLLLPARLPLDPLQLLLPVCIRLRPLQLLLPDCVRFNCCSPIVSASTAAPRLRPLQLLLLPDCIRFDCCCSPIASASTAAPHRLFWKIPARAQCSRTFFAEFEVQ